MSLCTMFAFEGVDDPNLLHCTHKYIPDDASVTRDQVIKVLKSHFTENPFEEFHPTFKNLEHLGKDGDYRTVTSSEKHLFSQDLLEKLDKLHPKQFDEYVPHVTVGRNTDSVDLPVRDYVLMDDHKQVWSARAHAERNRSLRSELSSSTVRLGGFDSALDESSGVTTKKKTPEEMNQNPNDLLEPTADQNRAKIKKQAGVWDTVERGEPQHRTPPGSGANEGQGDHDCGVKDNYVQQPASK